MSRITQDGPVVYFVRIGKLIKIGTTTNLRSRLNSFRNSATNVEILLTIPGGRDLEKKLHTLMAEARIERELFRNDHLVTAFIDHFKYGGMERGMRFLEVSTPAARQRKKEEDRGARIAEMRRTKAEKDAHFASLVAERKQRIGW